MDVVTRGKDTYWAAELAEYADSIGVPGFWHGAACASLDIDPGEPCALWQVRLLDSIGWHQIDNEGTDAAAIAAAVEAAITGPGDSRLIAVYPHPPHNGEPAHVHCLVAIGSIEETSDALNGRHLSHRY